MKNLSNATKPMHRQMALPADNLFAMDDLTLARGAIARPRPPDAARSRPTSDAIRNLVQSPCAPASCISEFAPDEERST